MGGYKYHRSTAAGDLPMEFVIGLFAPDLLKKWYKTIGIDETFQKYESICVGDMPDFKELAERIQQEEVHGKPYGTHYGKSSSPDIMAFWNGLTVKQRNTAFCRGYAWHLLGDIVMYKRIDIDVKFAAFQKANEGREDIEELKAMEKKKLHSDWDKTNTLIDNTYPDTNLPDWIMELGVVNYLPAGEMAYVDWNALKGAIDYMRSFDPVNGDMTKIIETILKEVSE